MARNFESNGPDVKIRGTASHIAEKYSTLARDAAASGDIVTAENYLQHAEHYNRIIMAAQSPLPGTAPQPVEGANGAGGNRMQRAQDQDSGGRATPDAYAASDESDDEDDPRPQPRAAAQADERSNGGGKRRRANGSGDEADADAESNDPSEDAPDSAVA